MMQESNDQKYASVLKHVNLPNTRRLNPTNQRLFQAKKQDINEKFASPELRGTRNRLMQIIQNQAQIFDNVDYNFVFPPTIFPQNAGGQAHGRRSIINVNRNVQNQDTFGHKLTSQQIQSIRQKGQFKVQSKINNGQIPHVWKINDWIVRGRVNIREVWQNGVSTCCQLIISSAIHFINQIPQNIKNILGLPVRFFDLIFGKRAITQFYSPDFNKEVAKDFWTDIMDNQLRDISKQIDHNFLKLLYVKYEDSFEQYLTDLQSGNNLSKRDKYRIQQQQISKLKSRISGIEDDFNSDWQKDKAEILEKISSPYMNSQGVVATEVEQKIVEKVKEQQLNRYMVHLRKNLPKQNLSSQAIEALLHLVFIVSYIDAKFRQKNRRISAIYSDTMSRIREQYPIRSRIQLCHQRLFEREYGRQKSKYEQQFYESLGNDSNFRGLLNPTYISIYQKYLKTKSFYDTLLDNKKKQLKCLYGPIRVFDTTYPLLPEYEVKTSRDYQNRVTYSLKKYQEMHTDTSSHFWKIKLYCMRYKSWTINWIVYLIGFAWIGPFGLRCLCGIEDFSYDENIDYLTGQKTFVKRETVLGKFKNVLTSIRKSRDDFQAQPDLGLLGKSVSRLCNYIQCYLFRFLVIGVLGVLTLYPIAIIFASLCCFVLVLTFWFWVPVAMIICYLFNIFIFQFQISYREGGCLIKSFPLVVLVLSLFFYLFRILFAFALLFVIAPLAALLYFVFLIIQRVLRTMIDCLMVCIISCCGRTPSTDTRIASRISGPGMAESYYSSIGEEDVYILVNAQLQKIFMQKFSALTRQKIQYLGTKHRKSIEYMLQPFGLSSNYSSNPVIQQAKQKLRQNFDRKFSSFMQRYPQKPYNVRFSKQQLKKYLQNSRKLVKNYIDSNRIDGWIYSQRGAKEGDHHEINKQIWRSIFGCGDLIFSPLEEINSRLKLEEDVTSNTIKLRNNMQSVMRTLQGQIQPLGSKKNISIKAQRVNLLNLIDAQSSIRTICQLHTTNSAINVHFDTENPNFLFVAPRNLQQAKQYDKKIQRESRKQRERRNQTILQFNYGQI